MKAIATSKNISLDVRSIVTATRSSSPIGRNAALCSLRFITHIATICNIKLTGRQWLDLYQNKLNFDSTF